MAKKTIPVALTIAGSDSGGGAGIQADLKTFAALGVHGTSVVTCITAQNPRRVLAIENASARIVRQQLQAVFAELPPRAVKTGMLYSAETIHEVVRFLSGAGKNVVKIVDPVLVATSGARLLRTDAMRVLTRELLPLADLITPNIPEAEALTGSRIRDSEAMRSAARALHERLGCAVLIKGGHLAGTRDASDIFFDGATELLLQAPRLRKAKLHGAGCTYSAAITAYCAKGASLEEAVTKGKAFITTAIHGRQRVKGHVVLGLIR